MEKRVKKSKTESEDIASYLARFSGQHLLLKTVFQKVASRNKWRTHRNKKPSQKNNKGLYRTHGKSYRVNDLKPLLCSKVGFCCQCE